MLEFPRWKIWLVSLVVAFGVLLSIPSLLAGTPYGAAWPKWLPQYKISLGLDLAGGSHLLLEADAQDAMKTRLQAMEDSVATELRRDPRIDVGDISTAGGRLSFMARDPRQVDAAVERMRNLTRPVQLTGNRDWDVQVVDSTRIVLTPTPSGTALALKDAMGVARDVVRRRIDPSGTKEITVLTEGGNRILVEVPGVEDPEALKRLIGQTARLEFKLVDQSANPADVQQGRAPPGSQVLPMADGTGSIAVKRRVMVSGDQIVKANQGYDQDGRPDIEIGFNTAGARRR
jgi:preprotein translocase subunit SecD